MTDLATSSVAPPQTSASARRFDHQLSILVDRQTAAYVYGLAAIHAEREGIRPKQGETIRDLLHEAIVMAHRKDPEAYAAAVRRGHEELARRARS